MEADITSQAVGLASNTDFSLWSLFLRADFIVKSVILTLIACSIYSWAIIIEKFKLFKKINESSEEFERKFWNSKSAESFYNNLPANVELPSNVDTMLSEDGTQPNGGEEGMLGTPPARTRGRPKAENVMSTPEVRRRGRQESERL